MVIMQQLNYVSKLIYEGKLERMRQIFPLFAFSIFLTM